MCSGMHPHFSYFIIGPPTEFFGNKRNGSPNARMSQRDLRWALCLIFTFIKNGSPALYCMVLDKSMIFMSSYFLKR